MSFRVEGFEWDEGNLGKCQKHGLTQEEIEEFFHGQLFVAPDVKHSSAEERFLAVGRNPQGRPMFVVFTLREGLIRPISARYMHEKEASLYEKTSEDENR